MATRALIEPKASAPKVEPKTQQYVTFYRSDGRMLSSESRPVDSRDTDQVLGEMPSHTYAFSFFEITSGAVDVMTLRRDPENQSAKHYVPSVHIYTLEDVTSGRFQRLNKGWYNIDEHLPEESKQQERDKVDRGIEGNMTSTGCDRILILADGKGGIEYIKPESIVLPPLKNAART